MKRMGLGKYLIATAAFACASTFSFSWSEQSGLSASIDSAQARVGRPLTPVSVAGVARRQNRRAAYGYGYGAGAVGAGVAAVGTAAAVAATQPWGWGGGPYAGSRYYNSYGSYNAAAYCAPGAYYIDGTGLVQLCP